MNELKKKRKSCIVTNRHYTHIYVYTISLVARPSRGPYSLHNFKSRSAGRTKFDRGPDLARGPDFGHACLKALEIQVQDINIIFKKSINV